VVVREDVPQTQSDRLGDFLLLVYWRRFVLAAGERVLTLASSQVLADAIKGGTGKFEPLVLPHAYSHLAPLAGVA
jgi:hypothetical protein